MCIHYVRFHCLHFHLHVANNECRNVKKKKKMEKEEITTKKTMVKKLEGMRISGRTRQSPTEALTGTDS